MSPDGVAMDHCYGVAFNPALTGPSTSQSHVNVPSTNTVLTTPKLPRVYLCAVTAVCGLDCVDDFFSKFEDNSVQCCECMIWLHFGCTDIKPENVPGEDDMWLCAVCSI